MVFKIVLIYTHRRWMVYLLSSVSPGHPLMGRFKGGQGGNVLRVRTILCSRQGIGVVVAVEEGDRRPSFGRWTRQEIYHFVAIQGKDDGSWLHAFIECPATKGENNLNLGKT